MRKRSLFLLVLFFPSALEAKASLSQFLQALETMSPEMRSAHANSDAERAELQQANFRLLPSLIVEGKLTRNEKETSLSFGGGPGQASRTIVTTPKTQRDFLVTATLPLIDVSKWRESRLGQSSVEESDAKAEQILFELKRQVAHAYFSFISSRTLLISLRGALKAAEDNFKIAELRKKSDLGSELDVVRARAEKEHQAQLIDEAQLGLDRTVRTLERLTGIKVDFSIEPEQFSVLDSEKSVAHEMNVSAASELIENNPKLRAARASVNTAQSRVTAIQGTFYPTLSFNAQNRWTNATGFSGDKSSWNTWLSAQWRLEPAAYSANNAAAAHAVAAQNNALAMERQVRSDVAEAKQRVQVAVRSVSAAKARSESSSLAAKLAREKLMLGSAPLYDVVLANRDFLAAEVDRMNALADYAFASFELALFLDSSH